MKETGLEEIVTHKLDWETAVSVTRSPVAYRLVNMAGVGIPSISQVCGGNLSLYFLFFANF